jgi:hypothetical protein
MLVARRALWFYARKLLCPTKLTFAYPHWYINAHVWWQYAYPLGAPKPRHGRMCPATLTVRPRLSLALPVVSRDLLVTHGTPQEEGGWLGGIFNRPLEDKTGSIWSPVGVLGEKLAAWRMARRMQQAIVNPPPTPVREVLCPYRVRESSALIGFPRSRRVRFQTILDRSPHLVPS